MSTVNIRFLGHSAFFFEQPDFVVAVDPWLEGNPVCPDKFKNPARLDVIALTHGHADHAGDCVRLAKATGAKIVATYELAALIQEQGIPEHRIIGMNKGGSVALDGLTITLTHAFHSSAYDTAHGTVYAGEPCGLVLNFNGLSIYHAGDTALFSDMSLIKEFYSPQVALLPIGDRFTMGPREAAHAAKLVGAKTLIPIHYKTFGLLTGTAEEFTQHCKSFDCEVCVLEPGETYSAKSV